jgi:putative membrane protein
VSGFLLRIFVNALVFFMVVAKLPGIFVDTLGGTLIWSAVVGLANAAIRPLLSIINFNSLSLGSFTFAVNLLTPLAVFAALPGYQISSILAPAAGIVLMTVCSYTCTKIIRDK